MITMSEILMGRVKFEDLEPEIQANLIELLGKINKLRTAVGRPLKVNDGLRRKGIDLPKNGAKKSTHYSGLAVDIDDDESAWLWIWVKNNLELMKEIGLYMEHPGYTHHKDGTWMHFQIRPPNSGKRIYVPSDAPNPNPGLWDGRYDSKYN
jgi:hypothetical protein